MADETETHVGPSSAEPRRQPPGLVLVFSDGGTSAMLEPRAVTGDCVLGRDPDVELRIDDSQVSRRHARIGPGDGGVLVTDLDSRNGIYVNGRRIDAPGTSARVGSILRCGNTLLAVVEDVRPFQKYPPSNASGLVGGARLSGIRRLVATIAILPQSVLLLGETGTGKERVAEALHAASERRGRFVAVNCNAIASNLVESELFGHVRGAFSGSDRARPGLFRAAEGGTLFLDEIGDLPLAAQGKLLRALETGDIRSVGADHSDVVDVRVIAATNADLQKLVTAERFRADLMHRISTWRIVVPPLRERREDIPALAEHFLAENEVRFSVEAMELLLLSRWRGNVRELRNAVQTAAARAAADHETRILPGHLPPEVADASPDEISRADPDAELRIRIETALDVRKGNVAQVARDLGRGRQGLYADMERLGIDPAAHRRR